VSDEVVVRPVERADVPAVIAHVARVLSEFGLVFGDGCSTDTELGGLPECYTEAGGAFWVAVQADTVLGTAGLFPLRAQVFELRKMYLAKEARGLGLGARLLAVVLGFARAAGARELVLDTTEEMAQAIAFYERHGFVRDDAQLRGERCTRGYRLVLAP